MRETAGADIAGGSGNKATLPAAPDDRELLRGILAHDMRRDLRR
jgi:hypothetical protein